MLIKGNQANLWTEQYDNDEWVDFMIFPRILALSESALTKENNKVFSQFKKSLPFVFEFLDEQNIYYFNSLSPSLNPEPQK